MAAFVYPPIATDSNYHAVALEVSSNGSPMPAVGTTVTISVKDRDSRDVIVKENTVVKSSSTLGRWEYWFLPEQVALITRHSIWLIEWKLTFGQYTWRLPEPAQLPVRKKL